MACFTEGTEKEVEADAVNAEHCGIEGGVFYPKEPLNDESRSMLKLSPLFLVPSPTSNYLRIEIRMFWREKELANPKRRSRDTHPPSSLNYSCSRVVMLQTIPSRMRVPAVWSILK